MPKESGPQGGGMNRREFLKTAAAGMIAAVPSNQTNSLEAQKIKIIDPSVANIVNKAESGRISYPEQLKPITPEVSDAVIAVKDYIDTYMVETFPVPDKPPQYFLRQDAASQQIREKAKLFLLEKLKFLSGGVSEASNAEVLDIIINKLFPYLAQFGIFAQAFLQNFPNAPQGKDPTSFHSEVAISFMEIDRVVHDKTTQRGVTLDREIVYLKGPLAINGRVLNSNNYISPSAQNIYGVITMNEGLIRQEFERVNKDIEAQRDMLAKRPNFLAAVENFLEKTRDLPSAIDVGRLKIYSRIKKMPTYEEYKDEVLGHETSHMVDKRTVFNQSSFIWTNDMDANSKAIANFTAHTEINAHISQLIHSPILEGTIIRVINEAKYELEKSLPLKENLWILGHIVGLISESPSSYGIVISKDSSLSRSIQIVTQLDKVLDHRDKFKALCERIMVIHNDNLNQNISNEDISKIQGELLPEKFNIMDSVGIPAGAAIVAAGAAYGAKKWIDRTKKVKLENMSRQQRKKEQKKKGKK